MEKILKADIRPAAEIIKEIRKLPRANSNPNVTSDKIIRK